MLLSYLPFLISANSLGVILLLVIMTSSVVFFIPAFATRGHAQLAWFGVGGFLLTVEIVIAIVLVVLTSQGEIFQ